MCVIIGELCGCL